MFNARENIFDYFKKGIFLFKGNAFKTKEEKSEEKKEETKEEYINNIFTFIEEKSKDINNDLFKKYLNFSAPTDLTKKLFETKDKKKNSEFVEEIKNRWSNLKDWTKKTSKEEIKNGKADDTLGTIKGILDFNKEIQKQQGSGLKILTLNQMLSKYYQLL